MLYFISDAKNPLRHTLCGNVLSDDGFLHPKRTLDVFVLILVREGTLHISQGNQIYDVKPNQFIVLFPEQNHFGVKPSKGFLSYYWVHFDVINKAYRYYRNNTFRHYLEYWNEESNTIHSNKHTFPSDLYILPEYGNIPLGPRACILLSQLLDISKQNNPCSEYYTHYALSLLVLEITQEYLNYFHNTKNHMPAIVSKVSDWLKSNCIYSINVQIVAARFNYNPRYLSFLFKQHTGYSLLAFIHRTRLELAKNSLVNSTLSIKEIAYSSGFKDEKNFLRLFKKIEGTTPTQYRNAFYMKKYNSI